MTSVIYVLHFACAYHHARHYVGFAEDGRVADRVNEHLRGKGRRPSPLVVVLATSFPGRDEERRIKRNTSTAHVCA